MKRNEEVENLRINQRNQLSAVCQDLLVPQNLIHTFMYKRERERERERERKKEREREEI